MSICTFIASDCPLPAVVELWHVWLMDYYEYDERPVIRKSTVSIADLAVDHIKELDDAEVWNNPERDRPSYYCLTVRR